MRGLLLLCVLTIVACCVHYASAQWPKWVLTKGVICEDRCKKIKNCDPLNEFSACKCFPRQYVKKWLQFNTLPMEPHLVCLMSVAGVVPKCCDIYKKEKDSYKNCASEIEESNEDLKKSCGAEIEELKNGHGTEIEELKTKLSEEQDDIEEMKKELGSCKQDGGDRTSNLTAEMLVLILEQNRNQNQEMEELKKRLDAGEDASERLAEQNSNQNQVIEQLEKRLEEERDDRQRQNSNQSQEIAQLEGRREADSERLINSITAQNQELKNLTQAWSSEPWKPFATELVKSVGAPSSIGFFAYMEVNTKFPKMEVAKFPTVVTNTGDGYNPSTGIFTCPEDGTYQFTFTALAKTVGKNYVAGCIIANGETYSIHLEGKVPQYIGGERTVLISLRKGDGVMISIESRDNIVWGGKYTAFGGFLAYK